MQLRTRTRKGGGETTRERAEVPVDKATGAPTVNRNSSREGQRTDGSSIEQSRQKEAKQERVPNSGRREQRNGMHARECYAIYKADQ